MICKYCGSPMSGDKCPKCGREFSPVQRSMSLDRLMANKPASASSGKTYDQGVREGYQRGLKEGYDNGFREGNAKAGSAAPVSPAVPSRPAVTEPPRKSSPWIRILLCSLIACLIGAAVSGFFMNNAGYTKGYQEGETAGGSAAEQKYTRLIQEQYEPAIASATDLLEEQDKQITALNNQVFDLEEQVTEQDDQITALTEQLENPERQDKAAYTRLMNLKNAFPLKKSRTQPPPEDAVIRIQQRLNDLGYRDKKGLPLDVNGQFGDNTVYAIKEFQKKYKNAYQLKTNGEVDWLTWILLFSDIPEADASQEIKPTGNHDISSLPSSAS